MIEPFVCVAKSKRAIGDHLNKQVIGEKRHTGKQLVSRLSQSYQNPFSKLYWDKCGVVMGEWRQWRVGVNE
jgi:hypothetical protein